MSDPSHAERSPFPTTHWSMVGRAGMSDSVRRRVLAALLRAYLPALRSFLAAKFRFPPDRVEDLVQGFIADKVLAQDLVRRADRERGRFRTFLMGALDRFVVDEVRYEKAAKRSPGQLASLDENSALDKPAPQAPDLFDAAWARQVLDLAVAHTREECDAGGRADVWAAFEGRVLGPTLHEGELVPIDRIATRFGVTPEQAFNLLVTGRRMFARHLRGVVSEYAEAHEIEDEIRALKAALGRSGV